MLSASDLDNYLYPKFDAALVELGFERTSRKLWVRRKYAPVCHVFSLEPWKGGAITPAFGISLDFVPHVSGKNVRWHRTTKSARYDLQIDPPSRWLDISTLSDRNWIAQDIDFVLPRSLKLAQDFWANVTCIQDVPASFDWAKHYCKRHRGQPFSLRGQTGLALAFLEVKLGDQERGTELLDDWLKWPHDQKPDAGRLHELLAAVNTK